MCAAGSQRVPATSNTFATAADRLSDQLENGIIPDLIAIEEAIFLLDCLDPHCDSINAEGFGHLITTLQRVLLDQVILIGARLFEREKNYPLRSLPAVLAHLNKSAEELPLKNVAALSGILRRLDLDISAVESAALTRAWASHCQKVLKQHVSALEPLTTLRNKQIAHREQTEKLSGAAWAAVHAAIDYAKLVVAATDAGYLTNSYLESGRYPLTGGAKIASRSMLRLLERARVISPETCP